MRSRLQFIFIFSVHLSPKSNFSLVLLQGQNERILSMQLVKNAIQLILIFLIISVSGYGCRNNKSKAPSVELVPFTIENNVIPNIDIPIPDGYEEVTIEELGKRLEKYKGETQSGITAQGIEKIKNSSENKALYSDTLNPQNAYWIIRGGYVDLNPQLASDYAEMLVQTLKERQNRTGAIHKLVSTNFKETKSIEYIKVIIDASTGTSTSRQTQYVISTKGETFTVIVMNVKGIDFENLIQKI
ncbi:hypothetical protein [Lewinella sp. IMCC34183]|uniref:hypothetical protein n=1 Tax=Lewinella sp. IMCC34183 TaxID=2248762 RepID=UPI001300406E|nr:hypothetical protein [Lewinella sp. IMCC34183]